MRSAVRPAVGWKNRTSGSSTHSANALSHSVNTSGKLKILLIAHSFPPAPVVGSFRANKVATAFRDAGHEVDVVTGRLPGERGELRAEEPGFCVHTVGELPGPTDLYQWLKRQISRTAPLESKPESEEGDSGGMTSEPAQERSNRWKRYILSALLVPDKHKGFIVPAIARSLPLIRGGVDLVYTTVPPFSDHLVGLALKKMTGVRWVAEFRDPWTDNKRAAHVRSVGADRVNRWLEQRCLEDADRVVSVAEGIQKLLAAKVPEHERGRFLLALNGIDNLARRCPPSSGAGPFRIVHIGSFYGGRDPRPFFHALTAVARKRHPTAADVRVELIGNSRDYHGISLESVVAELGIEELVEFHDWMPQEQARERARNADLLLLPFPHPHIIPNKLYDYLGTRRPILAFVHPRGEAAEMLNRVGGHYLVTDSDPRSAERALEAAFDGRNAPPPSKAQEAILEEWTTEVQMRRLLTDLGMAPGESNPASETQPVAAHADQQGT